MRSRSTPPSSRARGRDGNGLTESVRNCGTYCRRSPSHHEPHRFCLLRPEDEAAVRAAPWPTYRARVTGRATSRRSQDEQQRGDRPECHAEQKPECPRPGALEREPARQWCEQGCRYDESNDRERESGHSSSGAAGGCAGAMVGGCARTRQRRLRVVIVSTRGPIRERLVRGGNEDGRFRAIRTRFDIDVTSPRPYSWATSA